MVLDPLERERYDACMTSTRITPARIDTLDDIADALMDLPAESALTIINNRRQEFNDAEIAHLRFRLPQFTF